MHRVAVGCRRFATSTKAGPVERHIFANAVRVSHSEEDLHELFDIIDADNSGAIDRKELETLISGSGHISKEEIDSVLGSKTVLTFAEFSAFVKREKKGLLAQKLLSPYRIVFMVGGPGSGKGTYSKLLVDRFDFIKHVSSGDLLRAEVESGSELGIQIATKISHGELISASVVMALMNKSLESSAGKIVLVDGFPRSQQNAEDFLSIFRHCEAILSFECPEKEMIRRIVERGRNSGRSDDTEMTALHRISIFNEQSLEPVKYLQSQGVKLYPIDATKPIEHNLQELLKLPFFTPLLSTKSKQ